MMSSIYYKNIACLESLWDADVENKLTVAPLLEVIAVMNRIHFSHLSCNTLGELQFNLRALPRKPSYRILYLPSTATPERSTWATAASSRWKTWRA
jgi:hypothetical protein